MPLGDHYQRLLHKANAAYDRYSHSPPPIPHASKPQPNSSQSPAQKSPAQPSAYWSPTFDPSVPIWQYFEQETGQHGWGNNEAQNYTNSPTNAFFTPNGQLVLRAIAQHNAPSREQQFTSARLVSDQKLQRDSGCLIARLTAPSARGIWPAFWLLPAEPCNWPTDGEVDIFEAWNGEKTNHSCLHWGHYNGEDSNKHRVAETPIPHLKDPKGREYAFAWRQNPDGGDGKLVWYIDGKAVMKANIPPGTRRMSDFRIMLNIAMGGDVCQGVLPADGTYELMIHDLKMLDIPVGGWDKFENEWQKTKEGHAM